jgi:NAD(P)H-dependent FMN reductase
MAMKKKGYRNGGKVKKMSKGGSAGGKTVRRMSKGGAAGGKMTVAQLRSAAKKMGMKVIKA